MRVGHRRTHGPCVSHHHVRRDGHKCDETYLQHVAQLLRNQPLLLVHLVLPEAELLVARDIFDCVLVLQRYLKHMECRVPARADVPGQDTARQLVLLDDAVPGGQEDGRRMQDLVCDGPNLEQVVRSKQVSTQSLIITTHLREHELDWGDALLKVLPLLLIHLLSLVDKPLSIIVLVHVLARWQVQTSRIQVNVFEKRLHGFLCSRDCFTDLLLLDVERLQDGFGAEVDDVVEAATTSVHAVEAGEDLVKHLGHGVVGGCIVGGQCQDLGLVSSMYNHVH